MALVLLPCSPPCRGEMRECGHVRGQHDPPCSRQSHVCPRGAHGQGLGTMHSSLDTFPGSTLQWGGVLAEIRVLSMGTARAWLLHGQSISLQCILLPGGSEGAAPWVSGQHTSQARRRAATVSKGDRLGPTIPPDLALSSALLPARAPANLIRPWDVTGELFP